MPDDLHHAAVTHSAIDERYCLVCKERIEEIARLRAELQKEREEHARTARCLNIECVTTTHLRAEVAERDQRVRNMQRVEADVRAEYLRFEQRMLKAETELARLTREQKRGDTCQDCGGEIECARCGARALAACNQLSETERQRDALRAQLTDALGAIELGAVFVQQLQADLRMRTMEHSKSTDPCDVVGWLGASGYQPVVLKDVRTECADVPPNYARCEELEALAAQLVGALRDALTACETMFRNAPGLSPELRAQAEQSMLPARAALAAAEKVLT